MKRLSHVDENGRVNMVDVGNKPDQIREAKAEGLIRLNRETLQLIVDNTLKKGDVLTVSEIAGIQAAKRTSELIPLCHPIPIVKIEVKSRIVKQGVEVTSFVKSIGKTGVEMEALTAVHMALLTVYDMCKAVDKSMVVEKIHLVGKTKTDIL